MRLLLFSSQTCCFLSLVVFGRSFFKLLQRTGNKPKVREFNSQDDIFSEQNVKTWLKLSKKRVHVFTRTKLQIECKCVLCGVLGLITLGRTIYGLQLQLSVLSACDQAADNSGGLTVLTHT